MVFPKEMTRHYFRSLINTVIPGDSQFEAYVIDFYPNISCQFSNGMDRTQKINLFITNLNDIEEAIKYLHIKYPQEVEKFHHLHQNRSSHALEDGRSRRWSIDIEATFGDYDRKQINKIIDKVRDLCNDVKIELIEIKPGSIVLIVECAEQTYKHIKNMIETGVLDKSLKIHVRGIVPYNEENIRQISPWPIVGRDRQWNYLLSELQKTGPGVLFLPGAVNEGHEIFTAHFSAYASRNSIQEVRVLHVGWLRAPVSKNSYIECIEKELDTDSQNFQIRLATLAKDKLLCLIHPTININDENKTIVDLYTKWLPDILLELKEPNIKFIQPIAWNYNRLTTLQSMALFIGTAGLGTAINLVRNSFARSRTYSTLGHIKEKAPSAFSVAILPEFTPITETEVLAFLRSIGYAQDTPAPEAARLSLAHFVTQGATSSEEVVIRLYREFRELSSAFHWQL